jgi:hypothetical protein
MSDLDIYYRIEEKIDSGDHERFAHYADRDDVTEALIMGYPIMALCGKIWIPSRDPKKFPLCPTCKEVYESFPN